MDFLVFVFVVLSWLVGIAVTIYLIRLASRLVAAVERIARAVAPLR